MGDAVDMMLDGILDANGEYIDGKSPGYPRPHGNDSWKKKPARISHIDRVRQLVISLKLYRKWHHVAYDYMKVPPPARSLEPKPLLRLAKDICADFSSFEEYCKSLKERLSQNP